MFPILFLAFVACGLSIEHHGEEKECPPTEVFMNNAASLLYFISMEKWPFEVPFLRNSSETVEKELLDIAMDGSQTSLAMYEKLQRWLYSQDPAIKEQFENEERMIEEGNANIFAEIESTTNLTASEKEALEKMKLIGAKGDVPVKKQVQQVEAVLWSLPEEEQMHIHDFLVDAIRRFMPKHLHPDSSRSHSDE